MEAVDGAVAAAFLTPTLYVLPDHWRTVRYLFAVDSNLYVSVYGNVISGCLLPAFVLLAFLLAYLFVGVFESRWRHGWIEGEWANCF